MPELPEVEVTRRGVARAIAGQRISAIAVREPRLRWPVPDAVRDIAGLTVRSVKRRAKYLLLDCGGGTLIVHLGMSGSLRVLPAGTAFDKHDHFDLVLGARLLRLRDPRRFGAVLWRAAGAAPHPLLARLGIEPLSRALDGARLHALTRAHRAAIKVFLMDSRRIVGVGNIYASEALYRARIDPRTPARRLSAARCARLARAIKATLRAAIRRGRLVAARLRRRRRRRRLLPVAHPGVRPRGQGLPALRHGGAAHRAGAALDLLLPCLPALARYSLPSDFTFASRRLPT